MLADGVLDVVPLAPRTEIFAKLPAGLAPLANGRAAVSAVLASDTDWADAGHELAWGQSVRDISLPWQPQSLEPEVAPAGALRLGPVLFDRASGLPLAIGSVAADVFRLVLWWASTDNDLGSEWAGTGRRPLAGQWAEAGLKPAHSRLL